MSVVASEPAEVTADEVAVPGRQVLRFLGLFARRPSVIVSLVWLVVIVGASLFASVLPLANPLAQQLTDRLGGPSSTNLLGTDELGRDILSRLLHGGGELIVVSLIPLSVAYVLGIPVGLLVGFIGGRLDAVLSFVVNVLSAIPALVVVLAVSVITNNNLFILTAVLGVILSAGIYRLVRSSTQATRDLLYVDAARVSGVKLGRVLVRHILPNVAGPLIVQAFLLYAGAFLFLTSLSFLGLGFSPETPSWGQMVFDASSHLSDDPFLMVPIGVVLILTVAALNQLGAALLETLPAAKRGVLLAPLRRPKSAGSAASNTASGVADDRFAPAPDDPDIVLSVRDLVVSFPGDHGLQPVVTGVSFALRRGRTLGLVGESGCGKSMTSLATIGLVPPPGVASGSVMLGDVDLLQLDERGLGTLRGKRIGLVSQEPMLALDPCFTVLSQLVEPLRLHRKVTRNEAKRIAMELLAKVGIGSPEVVGRSFPHQLSGGMAQRVAIAIALAGEPEVLIADEPTTALDPTIQAEILALLRSLRDQLGLSIVLVTHDLGVVADICDDAAVMYAGQIVEYAPVEDILARPKHPYTKALLDAVPETAVKGQQLVTIGGAVPLPKDWPSSCRFADRCPLAVERCRETTIDLERIAPSHTTRCIRSALVQAPDRAEVPA